MADERLYSITEAAEKLGVSPATIATWIRLGIATASRQDELGRNRYTDSDLVEMERRFQERQARKRTRYAARTIRNVCEGERRTHAGSAAEPGPRTATGTPAP